MRPKKTKAPVPLTPQWIQLIRILHWADDMVREMEGQNYDRLKVITWSIEFAREEAVLRRRLEAAERVERSLG